MTREELVQKIEELKKEKNAIVLAHYYSNPDVQDIADFLGDSLELSRKAGTAEADVIVFAGVHFMAETAALISPKKKVLARFTFLHKHLIILSLLFCIRS
mgnify:CR=1 FL=1